MIKVQVPRHAAVLENLKRQAFGVSQRFDGVGTNQMARLYLGFHAEPFWQFLILASLLTSQCRRHLGYNLELLIWGYVEGGLSKQLK